MDKPARYDVKLPGCAPQPLMAYLKALGILRLVGEQTNDPEVRGWWQDDVFWLRSTLDEAGLTEFFLKRYRPTPILAPWAGGSGFFPKDNQKAPEALANSGMPRVGIYREAIRQARTILAEENIDKLKNHKARLLRRYRREFPDEVVAWMDAVMVLQQEGQGFAPLLGTGGNDGRLDFTNNFMQRIVALGLHLDTPPNKAAQDWLAQSLFGTPAKLSPASVGMFSPGRAGGPNLTQGMEGDAIDNPWDFIFTLEGTLVFVGAATRRFRVTESGRASFPFTVDAVAAGYDSIAASEEASSRGELWLPLWSRPASTAEIRQLFSEGRSEVAGRAAQNGTDFARAVASFGVDRGITEFTRFSFLNRSGRAYLATPLDRFRVVRLEEVDLLREISPWLDRFRRAAGHKNAPPRFRAALRGIDRAVFDFCKYGGPSLFQSIVVALGTAERELSLTKGVVGQSLTAVAPIDNLSREWIAAADDGSIEFAIARAVAVIRDHNGLLGSLRTNLEPVEAKGRWPMWAQKSHSVVWISADLPTNFVSVLQRRLMDAKRVGCTHLPLSSRFTAQLGEIAAFITNDLADDRIEQLIWGLTLVQPRRRSTVYDREARNQSRETRSEKNLQKYSIPREYALLKLLFLPLPLVPQQTGEKVSWRLARHLGGGTWEEGLTIRPEPRILALLRSGEIGEACRIAAHRLKVSGLTPLPGRSPYASARDDVWLEISRDRHRGQRLAASLLIPVSSGSVNDLINLVCRAEDPAVAEEFAPMAKGGPADV